VSDDIVERLLPFVVNEMRMPAGLTITVIEEIERLRDWHSEMFHYAADRDAEIERLRAALALADQMVDALQVAFDPSLGEESHDTIFGVWQEAQRTFAAYEEARRER
jgi:hypothetical protein